MTRREREAGVRVYISGAPEQCGNYRRAVERAGGTACFSGDPQSCDMLLLSGGGDLEPWRYGRENQGSRDMDPERDEWELGLMEWFAREGRPVLGICRGIQVMNVFFGGTLVQDLEGHRAEAGRDRFHPVCTADPDLQRLCGKRSLVNSAHHQAIDCVGDGLAAIQWAEDGVVEAIRHGRLPVLALQWHPERLGTPMGERIFDWFVQSGFSGK